MKKIFVLLAGVVLVALFGINTSASAAEINPTSGTTVADTVDPTFVEVLSSHLGNKIVDGNKEVIIIDGEGLQAELQAIDAPVTYDTLVNAVNNFNNNLKAENGEGPITELATTSFVLPRAVTCETVMSALGYIHAGSYGIAASLLGVTGPAAVAVPVLIGLAYQLGTLLC